MYDVLLIDTAGRLAIDENLMNELKNITNSINIDEIFYVADSLSGQDASRTAISFNNKLKLDGIILSKYEDILIKNNLLNKMHFENHKLKPTKINKLNMKIKNTNISLKEKKRLSPSPFYNKTRRNIKRS